MKYNNIISSIMTIIVGTSIVISLLLIVPKIGRFLDHIPQTPVLGNTPAPLPQDRQEKNVPSIPYVDTNKQVSPSNTYQTAQDALKAIRNNGKIIVAASIESGPFSYMEKDRANNKEVYKGFEVDIVKELAQRWFKVSNKEADKRLIFKGVEVANREKILVNDETVDFLIGAVTLTSAHCGTDDKNKYKLICTSPPHFIDKPAILVQEGSKIRDYCGSDLNNPRRFFVVLPGSSGEETMDEYKRQCKVTDIISDPKYSREQAVHDIKTATNPLKGYKTGSSLLNFYKNYFNFSKALRVVVDYEEGRLDSYGIWLTNSKEALKQLIQETLVSIRNEGVLQKLCQTHFGNKKIYPDDVCSQFAERGNTN